MENLESVKNSELKLCLDCLFKPDREGLMGDVCHTYKFPFSKNINSLFKEYNFPLFKEYNFPFSRNIISLFKEYKFPFSRVVLCVLHHILWFPLHLKFFQIRLWPQKWSQDISLCPPSSGFSLKRDLMGSDQRAEFSKQNDLWEWCFGIGERWIYDVRD